MIFPTSRTLWLFGASLPVTLISIITGFWQMGIAYLSFCLAVTLIDVLFALNSKSRFSYEVVHPERLFLGNEDVLRITVSWRSHWESKLQYHVLFSEHLRLCPPERSMADQGLHVLDIPLFPCRRGRARLHTAHFRAGSLFGLIHVLISVNLEKEIPVIPNILPIISAPIQFRAVDAYFGQKVQRMIGDGSEFEELREYLPGMDIRTIDWKRTAHYRKPVCKNYQTERNHNIILVFDSGRLMMEHLAGIPKIDHAINSALYLGFTCLINGDRVGLFAFDEDVRLGIRPISGKTNFPILQTATTGLEYHYHETNYTLGLSRLSTMLNRRSLIILFTDFVDTITAELLIENADRLVKRHLMIAVCFPDRELKATLNATPESREDVARAIVAGEVNKDRKLVFEKLRRLGIDVIQTRPESLSGELVNRYLRIKRKDLL